MKTVKIIIEKNADGFWAYAENEPGITGGGDTVQECKQDVLDCIETMKDMDGDNKWSHADGEYELVYRFDVESLLSYYKGIFTNSALEKITGINQRLIQHYASGLKHPREPQRKKIEAGLHRLADELSQLEL